MTWPPFPRNQAVSLGPAGASFQVAEHIMGSTRTMLGSGRPARLAANLHLVQIDESPWGHHSSSTNLWLKPWEDMTRISLIVPAYLQAIFVKRAKDLLWEKAPQGFYKTGLGVIERDTDGWEVLAGAADFLHESDDPAEGEIEHVLAFGWSQTGKLLADLLTSGRNERPDGPIFDGL